MELWARGAKQTEKDVSEELEHVMKYTDRIDGFTLICGFMCGMVTSEDGYTAGVFYLFGEYLDTKTNRSLNQVGKRWKLVENINPWDGFLRFDSVGAALEQWAKSYLVWSESFQRRLI
jgi:hypothetical protein